MADLINFYDDMLGDTHNIEDARERARGMVWGEVPVTPQARPRLAERVDTVDGVDIWSDGMGGWLFSDESDDD